VPECRTELQGCQIFLGPNIPNWGKYNKLLQTIPNQTATNYTKWPKIIPNGHKIYVPTFTFEKPSQIYPNLGILV
jgi:hypothetical protein